MTTNTDLAIAFFQATGSGDADSLRELCSESFAGSQNGGPSMNLKALIGLTRAVAGALPDFHYENAVRSATETGFVEEHDVCATLPDGSALRATVCVVAEVENGKITVMREYFDSAAAAPLLKALGG